MLPSSNSTIKVGIERSSLNGDGDQFILDHYENLHIQPQDDIIAFSETGLSQSLRAFGELDADIQVGDRAKLPYVLERLTSNYIVNGLFEDDSNWTNYNFEGGETNEQSTIQVNNGDYSRHVLVDNANEGIISDSFTIENGEKYRVNIFVYVLSGTVNITTEDSTIALNSDTQYTGEWEQFLLDFTSSSGSATEKIIIQSKDAGAEFYVDYVSVKKIKEFYQRYEVKGIKKYDFGNHAHLEIALEEYRENLIE